MRPCEVLARAMTPLPEPCPMDAVPHPAEVMALLIAGSATDPERLGQRRESGRSAR